MSELYPVYQSGLGYHYSPDRKCSHSSNQTCRQMSLIAQQPNDDFELIIKIQTTTSLLLICLKGNESEESTPVEWQTFFLTRFAVLQQPLTVLHRIQHHFYDEYKHSYDLWKKSRLCVLWFNILCPGFLIGSFSCRALARAWMICWQTKQTLQTLGLLLMTFMM